MPSAARPREGPPERRLAALDAAVRRISAELEPRRVLQAIVDAVRELAEAEYAALGIVDAERRIEQFLTSGIDEETRRRIGQLPRGHGLLGLIIREDRSYRIADIASHPASYGFPPHHPRMTSFLGVPIRSEGKTIGRLYLTDKRGARGFSAGDQLLVEMFALHAGIAMENARLHAEVQRLAVVDERERISRELHDSVIQSIYAVTLSLDDVPELVEREPRVAGRRVDDAIDALQGVIRDIRNFIFGLRPILLEQGGMTDGLRRLAQEVRRNIGAEVEVRVDERLELGLDLTAELLALAREALSNVARHAAADRVWLELTQRDGRLRLEIGDNGRGFEPAASAVTGHHGLANMRARAESLGGSFDIESAPGAGTRVMIGLPMPKTATQAEER